MSPDDLDRRAHDTADDLAWWCGRLGLGSGSDPRVLAAGQSGSRVVSVATGRGRAVVKITTASGRLVRARREIDLLRVLARRERRVAPELLGTAETAAGVAIALPQCVPFPAPDRITDRSWVEIATVLAVVHQPLGDLELPVERVVPRGSDHDQEWGGLASAEAASRGRELLRSVPELGLPVVLQHGDCHVENIVTDHDGRPMWIDWQEARPGDGLADLVFLWQRAEFAGARPPREAMTVAYAAGRGRDPGDLQPGIDHTELRLLLDAWPPFLGYGDDTGRAVMRDRLTALTSGSTR